MNPIGTVNKVNAFEPPIFETSTNHPDLHKVLLPPLEGSLPYTKDAYEKLPSEQKTPELDFFILGKIPSGKRDTSMPTEPLSKAFNAVVHDCLKRGELNALDFLWRESGRDPNKCTIKLKVTELDAVTANALCEHCRVHSGLGVKLAVLRVNDSAITSLISLIAQGKLMELVLNGHGLSSESLGRFASVMGQVTHKLTLSAAVFTIHSEKALGESLANSPCLKVLELHHCDFSASLGKQFVEGMVKNKSITHLKMADTVLLPTLTSGYGVLIAKNTQLEKLSIQNHRILPADISEVHHEVILMAAAKNKSLQYLNVTNGSEPSDLPYPGHLIYLLNSNRTLTELKLNVCLSTQHTMSVIEALNENTTLTDFTLRPQWMLENGLAKAIDDTLDRNRALLNDQFQGGLLIRSRATTGSLMSAQSLPETCCKARPRSIRSLTPWRSSSCRCASLNTQYSPRIPVRAHRPPRERQPM